jgi:hypothetical protein
MRRVSHRRDLVSSIREYERRYPSQTAVWQVGANNDSGQPDLVFAYYPTPDELKGSVSPGATHALGFPTEFVAATWKQPVDRAMPEPPGEGRSEDESRLAGRRQRGPPVAAPPRLVQLAVKYSF